MVGDGPERQKCESLTRELEICDQVKFLGKQEAVEDLLAIADLMVLPSETESFGLAALEAMACQVPVISSNTGGLPEININGQTGFLSDVGNYEDMAKNAIFILSDSARLEQFKTNALLKAQEFTIDFVVPQYEKIYRDVLASNL
jgi:N-acetyl-alpha-D-glucosaminyl L-malate synthase BshA